jgi:hypothetical protein
VRSEPTDPRMTTSPMRPRADSSERTAPDGQPVDGVAMTSWQDIKSRFVDDPARAIADAEALVQQAFEQRVRALKDEAAALRAQDRDEDGGSTETLRTRLIRYQAYCERVAGPGTH